MNLKKEITLALEVEKVNREVAINWLDKVAKNINKIAPILWGKGENDGYCLVSVNGWLDFLYKSDPIFLFACDNGEFNLVNVEGDSFWNSVKAIQEWEQQVIKELKGTMTDRTTIVNSLKESTEICELEILQNLFGHPITMKTFLELAEVFESLGFEIASMPYKYLIKYAMMTSDFSESQIIKYLKLRGYEGTQEQINIMHDILYRYPSAIEDEIELTDYDNWQTIQEIIGANISFEDSLKITTILSKEGYFFK